MSIHDTAEALTTRGYIIHQLCSTRAHAHGQTNRQPCAALGKVPIDAGWQKRSKPRTKREVAALLPNQGIGVLTGHGLIVVDCDVRGDESGYASLQALYNDHGGVAPPATVRTGGGGLHFWYRTTIDRGNTVGKLAPLIDTRGAGGQVVVPPSPHATGSAYTWVAGPPPALDDLPLLPQWMPALMREDVARSALRTHDDWDAMLSRHPLLEGTRNDSLNALAFWIGQRFFWPEADRWCDDLIKRAQAAGLDDAEITSTMESGYGAGMASERHPPPTQPAPPAPPARPPPDPPHDGTAPDGRRPGVELSPTDEGAAVRLLMEAPASLLLSRDNQGKSTIRAAGANGVWQHATDHVLTLHNRATDRHRRALEAVASEGARGLTRQIDYCNRSSGALGGKRAIESVGGALEALAATDPAARDELTICNEGDLDAQLHYLGAPNGVIDLRTGELLTGARARECLVTTMIPDPFEPAATHADVERLTAHMEPEAQDYLLDEIAFSLLGRPSRRILVLIGPKGGGKTTFSEAIGATLGNYASALGAGAVNRAWHSANVATPDMCSVMPPFRLTRSPEMAGLKIDPERAKALSAGDRQSFRPLYGAPQEGVPSATMMFTGNSMPAASQWLADDALLERLRVLTYPVVPSPTRDARMAGAFALSNGAEGRKRRQALAAKLLGALQRHCKRLGPHTPPEMPQAIAEESERSKDEAHGPLGQALRAMIEPGFTADVVTTADVWLTLAATFGHKDDKIEGLTRRQINRILAAMHELGPAKVLTVGGRPQRGWVGWRMQPLATAE